MKALILILLSIALVVGAWLAWHQHAAAPITVQSGPVPVAEAHFACDKGKFIDAAFYEGSSSPAVQPGQPPVPTGSADVSIDGGATTTLHQTISADGVRYANTDESFVFWNKGNQALIMHDNSMDLDHTNCTDTAR